MPTIDADDMHVVGPDGMLDSSMEAPLKFEEDETWDNAPSQEDPFMSFFPTGTHLPAHEVDLVVDGIILHLCMQVLLPTLHNFLLLQQGEQICRQLTLMACNYVT